MTLTDDEDRRLIAQLQAQLLAFRLVNAETLSIILEQESNPDLACSLIRKNLNEVVEKSLEKMLATAPAENADFRSWYTEVVRETVKQQLDAVETRLSQRKIERKRH